MDHTTSPRSRREASGSDRKEKKRKRERRDRKEDKHRKRKDEKRDRKKPKKRRQEDASLALVPLRPQRASSSSSETDLDKSSDEEQETAALARYELDDLKSQSLVVQAALKVRAGPSPFLTDRRGDKDASMYDRPYRLDVPLYRSAKRAGRELHRDDDGGCGRSFGRRGERASGAVGRYFGKEARRAEADSRLGRWRLCRSERRAAIEASQAWQQSNAGGLVPIASRDAPAALNFIPVEPVIERSLASLESDEDDAAETDAAAGEESLERSIMRRTGEFNRVTREDPHNVVQWLAFADFQSETAAAVRSLGAGGGGSGAWALRAGAAVGVAAAATTKEFHERQLEVLGRAARDNPRHLRLALERACLARLCLSPEQTEPIWRSAMTLSMDAAALSGSDDSAAAVAAAGAGAAWRAYLAHKRAVFADFTLSAARRLAAEAAGALSDVAAKRRGLQEEEDRRKGVIVLQRAESALASSAASASVAESESGALELLYEHWLLERMAGWEFRAVAGAQATLEGCASAPALRAAAVGGREEQLQLLAEFWDAEFPRIGDGHPSTSGLTLWHTAHGSRASKPEHAEALDLSGRRKPSRFSRWGAQASSQPPPLPPGPPPPLPPWSASVRPEVPPPPLPPGGAQLDEQEAPTGRRRRPRAADFFFASGEQLLAAESSQAAPFAHPPLPPEPADAVQPPLPPEPLPHVAAVAAPVVEAFAAQNDVVVSNKALARSEDVSEGVAALERAYEAAMRATAAAEQLDALVEAGNEPADAEVQDEVQYDEGESHAEERAVLEEPKAVAALEGKKNMQQHSIRDGETTMADLHRSADADASLSATAEQQQPRVAAAADGDGLIWVDEAASTAYSVRHGYRIRLDGVLPQSAAYKRILSKLLPGGASAVDAAAAAAAAAGAPALSRWAERYRRRKEARERAEASVLTPVAAGDSLAAWASTEERLERERWAPLRALADADAADADPDRVVLWDDLNGLVAGVSHPETRRRATQRFLQLLGVTLPRSATSHARATRVSVELCDSLGTSPAVDVLVAGVGAGAVLCSLCGGALAETHEVGNVEASARPWWALIASDQLVLPSAQLLADPTRQRFVRNALHALLADSGGIAGPGGNSSAPTALTTDAELRLQLQCVLMLVEGHIAAAAAASHPKDANGGPSKEAEGARTVAKALLEASEGKATDLRLWSTYVHVEAAQGSRDEALRVARKALAAASSLPAAARASAPELFWAAFRLEAGLRLVATAASAAAARAGEAQAPLAFDSAAVGATARQRALHMLVCMAEGSYSKPRSKGLAVSPVQLLRARKLFAEHLQRETAAVITSAAGKSASGALDCTPPLFYYAAGRAWLQLLSSGLDEARAAIAETVDNWPAAAFAGRQERPLALSCDDTDDAAAAAASAAAAFSASQAAEPSSLVAWAREDGGKMAATEGAAAVGLERFHRAACELLLLAARHGRGAGIPSCMGSPVPLRTALHRAVLAFPLDPGLLSALVANERHAAAAMRLAQHLSAASLRRARAWPFPGPTAIEWLLHVLVQVALCEDELAYVAALHESPLGNLNTAKAAAGAVIVASGAAHWSEEGISRLRRVLERALGHPRGRSCALLWRIYVQAEASRGCFARAKRAYVRAVHACPWSKRLWLDACRRPVLRRAFAAAEAADLVEVLLEKGLGVGEDPSARDVVDEAQ